MHNMHLILHLYTLHSAEQHSSTAEYNQFTQPINHKQYSEVQPIDQNSTAEYNQSMTNSTVAQRRASMTQYQPLTAVSDDDHTFLAYFLKIILFCQYSVWQTKLLCLSYQQM